MKSIESPVFRVRCLASGSKGNAYLFYDEEEAILVDAGIRLKTFDQVWKQEGLSDHRLLGICVTHEHSDHIQGAESIARKWGCPIFASAGTLEYSWRDPEGISRHALRAGEEYQLGSWSLLAVSTHHDAREPLFFCLTRNGASACVLTDTGIFDESWSKILSGCSLVFLESNYEESLLENGPYPYPLQQRIRGAQGHLSNQDAFDVIRILATSACKQVVLAHLSEKNNQPDLALLRPLRWLQGQQTQLTVGCLPPKGQKEPFEVYAR